MKKKSAGVTLFHIKHKCKSTNEGAGVPADAFLQQRNNPINMCCTLPIGQSEASRLFFLSFFLQICCVEQPKWKVVEEEGHTQKTMLLHPKFLRLKVKQGSKRLWEVT